MRVYEVTQDTPAAIAIARTNPQHGSGGAPQLFISDYEASLRPIDIVALSK